MSFAENLARTLSPFPPREGGRGVRFARGVVAMACALLFRTSLSAGENTVLARTTLDGAEIQLLQPANAKLVLKLADASQSFTLAIAPWPDGKGLRAD